MPVQRSTQHIRQAVRSLCRSRYRFCACRFLSAVRCARAAPPRARFPACPLAPPSSSSPGVPQRRRQPPCAPCTAGSACELNSEHFIADRGVTAHSQCWPRHVTKSAQTPGRCLHTPHIKQSNARLVCCSDSFRASARGALVVSYVCVSTLHHSQSRAHIPIAQSSRATKTGRLLAQRTTPAHHTRASARSHPRKANQAPKRS